MAASSTSSFTSSYAVSDDDQLDTFINSVPMITGPAAMSMTWINNRLLLMFGDIHIVSVCDEEPGTIRLTEFLDQVFTLSGTCIDALFETTKWNFGSTRIPIPSGTLYPADEPKYVNQGEILDVNARYENCLRPDKTGCPYPNVRFHNIDPRSSTVSGYNFDVIHDYVNRNDGYSYAWQQRDLYRSVLSAILEGKKRTTSQLFRQIYANIPELAEFYSFENILRYSPYPKIWTQIEFNPMQTQIQEFILKQWDFYVGMARTEILSISSVTNLLLGGRSVFARLIMDAYALGRLTKIIFNYSDSRLCILYAGRAHTRAYLEFFRSNGYPEHLLLEARPDKLTCLPLNIRSRSILIENLSRLPNGKCALSRSRKSITQKIDRKIVVSNVSHLQFRVNLDPRIPNQTVLGWSPRKYPPMGDVTCKAQLPLREYIDRYLRSDSITPTAMLTYWIYVEGVGYGMTPEMNPYLLAYTNKKAGIAIRKQYPNVEFLASYYEYLREEDLKILRERPRPIETVQTSYVLLLKAILKGDHVRVYDLLSKIFPGIEMRENLSLPIYTGCGQLWSKISPAFRTEVLPKLQQELRGIFNWKLSWSEHFLEVHNFLNDVMLWLTILTTSIPRIVVNCINYPRLLDLLPGNDRFRYSSEEFASALTPGCIAVLKEDIPFDL